MIRTTCLFAVCLVAMGCTVMGPTVQMHRLQELPSVNPDEVAALAPGSKVEIVSHSGNSDQIYMGTVLKSGPQGVALMNCESSFHSQNQEHMFALHRMPFVGRLFKVSGFGMQQLPVEWVSIQRISDLRVIEPPPPRYVAPDLNINTDDRVRYERFALASDSADLPVAGPNVLIGRFDLTEREEEAMMATLNDPDRASKADRILDKAAQENRFRWEPSEKWAVQQNSGR